jgi:diguanylate cyclase (GGDEF)-like protein
MHLKLKSLEMQAYYDSLTGLANRSLLADRFRLAMERAKRSRKPFAVLMVDLNDFKAVNDGHGHAAGDAVLVASAQRLVSAVRGSDTVARLGGDEFVLIIESFEESHELIQIGRKLIDSLSEEHVLQSGVTVRTGASVGFAVYPNDGSDMNDMLNLADQSMYDCKSSGMMVLS